MGLGRKMSLIEKIQSAQAADSRIEVYVARWGETLYFKRITSRDVDAMKHKYPDMKDTPSMKSLVGVVVDAAMTKDGEKAFTIEHKPLLMSEPVEVINHIVKAIMPTDESAIVEETEKN